MIPGHDDDGELTDEQIEAFLDRMEVSDADDEDKQAQFVELVQEIVTARGGPITEEEAENVWSMFLDMRFKAAIYNLWTTGLITIGLSRTTGNFTFRASDTLFE